MFNAETQGIKLLLGNVYFPTRDKEKLQYEFLQKLEKSIVNISIPNCPMILGGDFNTMLDEKLDYIGPNTVFINKFNIKLKEF